MEVDRVSLRQLQAGVGTRLITNVSESVTRSLVEGPQSRTLQSFQLTTVDLRPVQFRVSSRVGSLDVGMDFELTARVSVKREIHITLTGQMEVRHREDGGDPSPPVFTGQSIREEITTAEGASILVAGFITEREAPQLAKIEAARDSPLLKSLFSDNGQSLELVLVLTPHIVRAGTTADVTLSVAPPAVAPPSVAPRLDTRYSLQVGAFQNRSNASALFAELTKRHQDVFIQEPSAGQPLYRVCVGRLPSIRGAKQVEKLLRSEGFTAFVSQLR